MKKSAADIVRAEIARIAKANGGRLTAEMVWQEARNPSNPLHRYITWDQAKAAKKHQIDQVRGLIRSVRVEYAVESTKVVGVGYVRDPLCAPHDQGYVSVAKVRSSKDESRDVLIYEFKRAIAALDRAKELAHIFGLEKEIDLIMSQVASLDDVISNAA